MKDILLNVIKKWITNYHLVWPEIIKLLILDKIKKDDDLPLDKTMSTICDKLSTCKPENFSQTLTYDEKLELLQYLVDMIHD